jgi:hypothetical protein
MTSWRANQREMKGRNTLTIAEFKTMLTLETPVSILEEIDRLRGKMSRSEFSSVILEAGLLLSYQEKIIVITSVVVPSGRQVTNKSPQTAATTAVVVKTTATPQEPTQEVEVVV